MRTALEGVSQDERGCDAVNTTSRMESHRLEANSSERQNTDQLLKDEYNFEHRGQIEIKGKGQMKTY
ncbi:MAG: adenylate/guanylate cyclase domain-containing protein [Halothece sp.]